MVIILRRKLLSKLKMLKLKELKQRLEAKAHTMKRYIQRIEQQRVNKLFDNDQKTVYPELNRKKNNESSVSDTIVSQVFWSKKWSLEKDMALRQI